MEIDNLIELHKPLIYKISSNFFGYDKEDLFQLGVIGIIKARKNYKENNNVKFSSYAFKYIYGEMYNYVSRNSMKVNKDSLVLYKKILKLKDYLTQKNNKVPSNNELASFLNIEEYKINELNKAMESISSFDDESVFDEPIYTEDYDIKLLLNNAINELSEREKKVILYRYYKDYSQSEVAKILGLSQVTVSREEQKSLKKMRSFVS